MSINPNQSEVNAIELYFEWYLRELKDNGFIKDFYREPHVLNVVPKAILQRYVFTKTTAKVEDYSLLQEDNYKYDYLIVWNKEAEDIFYSMLDGTPIKSNTPFYAFVNQQGDVVSLCDVKPPPAAQRFSGGLTTALTFPVKQKILWRTHGIFINKSVPIPTVSKGTVKSGNSIALFTTTFCPVRYTFTDSGRQPRKIGFKTRSLAQYLTEKRKEVAHANAILQKQNPNTLF